jgi:methenyltetrahydrofolate cyclohydrolase
MMCDITIGKPKYAGAEPRLKQIRSDLSQFGARLRELIAEDAESFEAVLRAYRMPKDTDEQKSERASTVQTALRRAVDVPLETAQSSLNVLMLLRELADLGTPNALSDVAVGARLAEVAIRGASYNVGVNLDSLSDDGSEKGTRRRVKDMIERSGAIAGEVEAKMKV